MRHLQGLVIDCPENYNRHPVNVDFAYAIRSSFQHTNHVNDRSTPHYGPRDVRTPSGHFPGGGGHQNQESARSVSSQTQDGVQNNTTPSKKKKKTSKSSRSKVGMSQTGSNDSLAAGDSEHGTTAKGDASAKQRGNSLKQSGTDGKAPATNPNGPHARDTVATSRDSHDTAASRDKAQKSTGADPPKGRQSERPSSRANKKEQSTGSDSKSKAQDNAAQSTGAKNKKHRPEKSGSTALETLTKPSQPPPTTEAPPGKQKSVQNPSSTKGNAKAKDSKDVPSNTGKKSSTSDKKETSKPSEATTPAVAQSSQPRWADVIPSSDDPKSPPRPSKGSKKPSAVDQGRSKTGKAKHTKQNPNQSQAAPKPESTKLITDASPNSKNQQVSVDSESQIKTGQSGSNGAAKEKQRALSNPQPQASVPPLKHGTSQDQGKKTQKGVGKAANHGRSRTPEAPKPKNDNPHIPRATSNIELSNPYSALSDTNKSTPIESRSSSSKQSDKLVSFAAPVATPSPKAISCMDGTNSLSPSPKTPTRLRETISHVETPTSASPPVMTHKRKKSKAISVSSSVAESEATTVIKTDETPPTNEVVSRMTNPEMGSPGRVTEIGPKADQTAADQEPDVDSAPPHAKDETIEPSSTSPPESKDQEPPTSSPTTTNEVRAGLLKAIKDYDSSASETTDNHPNETTATASPTDPPTKEKRTHNRKSKKSKTSQTSESNSVDLNALSTDNDVENMQSASTRDAESPEPTEEITRVSSGGYSRFQDEMTEAEKFQWVTDHIASSGRPCKEVRAWDLAVAPYVKIYTVKTMADLERDMKQNVYQRYARITREFEENRKRRALPTDSKPLSQRRKKTQKRIPTPPDHKSDNQGGSDAGLTITESQNEAQSSRSVDVNKPIGNTVKAFVPTKLNDDPSPTDPTGTPQVSSATNRPYSDETTPKITLPSDFVDRAPSSDEEARDYIKRAQDPAHWQGVLAKSKQKAKEMFPEVDDEMLDSENQELEKIRKDFAEWLTDEDTDGEPKSLPAARERRVTSSPTELHSPVSPRASQRSRRPVLINTPSAPPNTPASASKTSSRRQSHSVVGGGVTPALDDLKEDSPSKEASNDSLKSSSSTLKGDEAEASKQLTLDGLPPRMRMVTELLSAGSLNFEEIMSRLSTLPEQEDQEDFEAFKRSRENEIATDDGTTSPSKRKDSSASKNSNGDAIATDDGTASALERQASKTSKNSNEDAIVTDDTSALERQASKVSKSSNEDAIVTDDGTAWPTLGPKSTRSQSSTTKRSESPMSYSKLFSEVAGSSPARGGRTNSLVCLTYCTTFHMSLTILILQTLIFLLYKPLM